METSKQGGQKGGQKTVEKTVEKTTQKIIEEIRRNSSINGKGLVNRVGENVPENVPENRLVKIRELMSKYSKITIPEIGKELKVNEKTIKRDIEKLKALGKINRIGPDKGGHWEVV